MVGKGEIRFKFSVYLGNFSPWAKVRPPPLTGPFPRVGGKERSVGEGVWVAGLSPGLVNRPPS